MNINILYNDSLDEFSYDLSLEMRVRQYIFHHFYPAYTISMLSSIYLVGGAIRDLLSARHPKDMDFVVLGKKQENWVLEVLNKYHIEYGFNKFGGYKFNYEGTTIDLWVAEDLFSSMQYNVDGLYFDLKTNSLLSFTFDNFIHNGLTLVNPENNIENGREKKLIRFQQEYFNLNKK